MVRRLRKGSLTMTNRDAKQIERKPEPEYTPNKAWLYCTDCKKAVQCDFVETRPNGTKLYVCPGGHVLAM